ncbi:hypothetical protein ASPZODRAFT_1279963 [Penicilliopsis zonata CBS 506.65]|uniref:Uncharacterized protein n=1 Tax=Penicilliopsis zonata CBS 506.65 TaxID=1073090 RepID=A0A1L9S6S6_9EURO|nr:hypothetical protein ASPZODRAFT_1279963 [Penicilliopsis zonata CBS 506.65]OJJ42874.1 hypothetical protein ASPZODRAFT_1279963 [Penicilliopsis zonata CBS 506.65]
MRFENPPRRCLPNRLHNRVRCSQGPRTYPEPTIQDQEDLKQLKVPPEEDYTELPRTISAQVVPSLIIQARPFLGHVPASRASEGYPSETKRCHKDLDHKRPLEEGNLNGYRQFEQRSPPP